MEYLSKCSLVSLISVWCLISAVRIIEMWCSVLPLLLSLSPAVLFLLQLPDYTTTQEGYWEDDDHGHQGSELRDKKHFCSWKCLMFTLQWPGGFCQVSFIVIIIIINTNL